MRIAIIGTGIAGNVAAWQLRDRHDITIYESGSYVGGHTNTIDVDEAGRSLFVDPGGRRRSAHTAVGCWPCCSF